MSTQPFMILGSSGNIGTAATRILLQNGHNVIAADWDNSINTQALIKAGLEEPLQNSTLKTAIIDARAPDQLMATIVKETPALCISTLPAGTLSYNAALACALTGKHYISSNFITDEARQTLDEKARALGLSAIENFSALLTQNAVTSAWERGLDPGLDSWLFQLALEEFSGGAITSIKSTGAGVSEHPEDIYFYTWAGITNGMGHRPAKVIRNGRIVEIAAHEKFHEPNRKHIDKLTLSDGITLETYANDGGILHLISQAQKRGIQTDSLQTGATLTGRHKGHCALWDPLVRVLGILDDNGLYEQDMSMAALIHTLIKKHHAQDPHFAEKAGDQDLHNLAQQIINSEPGQLAALGTLNPLAATLTKQGFFSPAPLNTGAQPRTAKHLTEAHLSKTYARQDGKRDRSIIHIEITGTKADNAPLTKIIEVNAYGDPALNGLSSMQKTVAGTLVQAAFQAQKQLLPIGLHGAGDDLQNGRSILKQLQDDGTLTLHHTSYAA